MQQDLYIHYTFYAHGGNAQVYHTPLSYAAFCDNFECVQLLLYCIAQGTNKNWLQGKKGKFDPNFFGHQQNQPTRTALHYAVQHQNIAMTEAILQVQKQDVHGITPFHLAFEAGNESMIECLINNGADPASTIQPTQPTSVVFSSYNEKKYRQKIFIIMRPKEGLQT